MLAWHRLTMTERVLATTPKTPAGRIVACEGEPAAFQNEMAVPIWRDGMLEQTIGSGGSELPQLAHTTSSAGLHDEHVRDVCKACRCI